MLISLVKDLGLGFFDKFHYSVWETDAGTYEFVERFVQAGISTIRHAPALSDPITWTVQNLQAALHGR